MTQRRAIPNNSSSRRPKRLLGEKTALDTRVGIYYTDSSNKTRQNIPRDETFIADCRRLFAGSVCLLRATHLQKKK